MSASDNLSLPLKLKLCAMSDKTSALIEYYIDRNDQTIFTVADERETPDVVMIDHDHPGTRSAIAAGQWQSVGPIVVLAMGEPRIDDAIIIKKPLNSLALDSAAQQVVEALARRAVGKPSDVGSVEVAPVVENANAATDEPEPVTDSSLTDDNLPKLSNRFDTAVQETPPYFRTADAALPAPESLPTQKRIKRYTNKLQLLCGESRTLSDFELSDHSEHRYDPADYLSSHASKILRDSQAPIKAVQLTIADIDVYLLPTLNKVFTSASLEYKSTVHSLFNRLDPDMLQVRNYSDSNVNELVNRLNEGPRFAFSGTGFQWLSTLFCARGRLPVGFDIHQKWQLSYWPNLTRLELTPDCLELAAAWSNRSYSLAEVVDVAQCEVRFVTSFFNASHALQLMKRSS